MAIRYNKFWLVSALVMLIFAFPAKSQTIEFTPTNVTCNGADDATMQIDVSGYTDPYWYVCYDMNYQVNNDSVGPTTAPSYTFTNLIPGRPYIFVVKDAADPDIWLGFYYYLFTEPGPLNATYSSTNINCFGASTGSITISSVSGGYGQYDFTIDGWATHQTTGSFTNLPAGFYNVQIRDRANPGCVLVLNNNLEITQNPQLNATLTATNPKCAGVKTGSIELSAPTGGTGTGYQYTITGGTPWSASTTGTYTYTTLGPGTYNVVMRDAAVTSCTRTLNGALVITEPTPLATPDIVIQKGLTCNEGSDGELRAVQTGGTPPYSYTWQRYNGSTYLNIGQTTQVATTLNQGRYRVLINDANLCGPTQAVEYFLEGFTDSIPPVLYHDGSVATTTCDGQSNGSIDISAHGGIKPYQFSITTGGASGYQADSLFSNLGGGTYQSWVMDRKGCKKAGPDVTVGVTPNAPVSVSIVANPATAICPATSVTFTATPVNGGTAPAYQWKLNGTNVGTNSPTYTNATLANGDQVSVVLTSDLRCTTNNPATSNTITASVLVNTAITAQPVPLTQCAGTNATFNVTAVGSNLTYQWRKNGANISGATLASYTINNIAAADAGNYSVVVTGSCGTVTSNNAALVVNPLTAITVQPVPVTQCAGTDATFTVTAVGTNLSYQWRKDGTDISGETSASLTLNDITAADAGNYSVVVSGDCGADVVSNNAALVVNPLTAITAQPVAVTACAGTNVMFSVTAVGTNLTFQWRKNGANISGATSASYIINNITAADAGNYSVVITGTCGTVTSSNAALVVNPLTAITAQPSPLTQCAGTNATFNVSAVGTNLTYQWRKNGTDIPGANSASYTIINITAADAGNYSVVVSGDCGADAVSNNAALVVNPLTAITAQPVSLTQCAGTNATFNVTAVGTNLTYQWRKNGVNIGSATSASYTINNITAADAANYSVMVSGSCGVNVLSDNATLTVNPLTAITVQPQPVTECAGGNVTFNVTAVGTNLTYQWRKNGTDIAGETSASLTLNNITAADAGNYSVVVSGDCGADVTSNNALLTVNPLTAITAQPSPLTQCAGTNATFNVTAVGTNLTYQWRKNGVNIGGATSASYTINNINAGDAGNYDVVVSGSCGADAVSTTVSLTVNPLTAITIQPSPITECTGGNVTFNVTAVGTNLTYQWRKDGTDIAGETSPSLTLSNIAAADAGNYSVIVSGDCGADVISNNALLTVNPLTAITGQPVSLTQCAGTNAAFTVTAVGTNLTYQWRKDGTNISGATNASYTINNITAANAGNYSVVVSGSCGADAVSNDAALTVNPLTAITAQPVPLTQCAGTNVTFTVTAVGTNLTYQWRKNGTDITGETAASITLNNITAADAGNYSVVVSGDCGADVTSNNALLTVNPLTAITVQPVSLAQCTGDDATFTVTAVGTNLTYQWRKNGTDIPGANAASYTLNNITAADAGNFDVVVSGSCGADAVSNLVSLVVNPATAILTQPVSLEQCVGTDATFTVVADGTNITYQWRKNGTAISGTTADSYTINNITAADAGNYTVVVSGDCGADVTSDVATLTVNLATSIVTQPVSATRCVGTSATFSVSAVGTNLVYQWQKNGTDIPGATGSEYTLSNIIAGDAGNYTVLVSGDCGADVLSDPAALVVNPITAITTQPAAITDCEGNSVTFTVIADGSTLQYQWRKDGVDIPGATGNAYTIAAITPADEGNYSVVVTGDCGSETSQDAYLTVNIIPVITTQPQDVIQCTGTDVLFTVVSTGLDVTYTWRKNGVPIVPAETNDTLILGNIDVTDAGNYDVVVSNACGSAISDAAVLTVAESPVITLQPGDRDLCEGGDVTFTVAATGTDITYQWRKDGVNLAGETSADLNLTAVTPADDGNYDVVVYGMCDTLVSNTAVLIVYPATRANIIDNDTIVCKESNVELNVAATGYGSLTYQWQRRYYGSWMDMVDDARISGSTTPVLTINVADLPDSGLYRVLVQGGCGPAFSDTMRLDINSLIATIGTPAPFMINSTTTFIEVGVTIENHFLKHDLGFALVAPDGTEVMLKAPGDYCVPNHPVDVDVKFNTEADPADTIDYCTPGSLVTGTFAATGNWDVLHGMDPSNGAWEVRIYDAENANGDVYDGVITSATLTFIDLDSNGDTAVVDYNSGPITTSIINPLSGELRPTPFVVPIRLMTTCFNTEDAHAIVTVEGGIPPFTYDWTGPTTVSGDDAMLGKGTYSVLVTDAIGCTSIATVEVTSPPAILWDSIMHTDTIACFGSPEGTITGIAMGGAGSFSYTLLPGDIPSADADTGRFHNLTAGAWTVRATDIRGCMLDTTVYIYENDPLAVQIDVIPVTGIDNGSITLTASGGVAPYRYSIDNGATLQPSGVFTGLSADIYYIYVVDTLGCSFVDTVNLNIQMLDVMVSKHNVSCFGLADGSFFLAILDGVGPYQLTGSFTDTLTSPTGPFAFTGQTAGRYDVKIEDAAGRMYIDTIDITEPTAILATAAITPARCAAFTNDGAIDLVVTGGSGVFEYFWSNGAKTEDIIDISPGDYQVTIADTNGCSSEIFDFTVGYLNYAWAFAGYDTLICYGESLQLNGSPGDTVRWVPMEDEDVLDFIDNPEIPNPIIKPEYMSLLYYRVYQNGCMAQDEIIISVDGPNDFYFEDPNDEDQREDSVIYLIEGETVTLDMHAVDWIIDDTIYFKTIEWSPVDNFTMDPADSSLYYVNPTQSQTYTIVGITKNGCKTYKTIEVIVAGNLLIYTGFSPNSDGINDTWEIEHAIEYGDKIRVRVYNRWGELVFESKGYGGENAWDGTRNGRLMPVGSYYYIIDVKDGKSEPYTGTVTILR